MVAVENLSRSDFLWTPLQSRWRWPLIAATLVTAAAHVPVIEPHLRDAPYMGEEFIVLTLACVLLGLAAFVCDSPVVYSLTVVTCGLAILGYVATRLMAFPLLADDVGNWFEPFGVVSVLAEFVAVVAVVNGLSVRTRLRSPARV